MSYDQTSLTTNLDNSVTTEEKGAGAVAFAGVLLIMMGLFHALQGLVALFNDDFYVVGANYWFRLDFTTWGWLHLILGLVAAGAGLGLFYGQTWARVLAVVAAGVSMIASFMWLPFYPVWSLVVLALDVLVMWAAIVHGRVLVDE
jgi:hypothetical protein